MIRLQRQKMETVPGLGLATVKFSHRVLRKPRHRSIYALKHRLAVSACSSSKEDTAVISPAPVLGEAETATAHGATAGVAKRPPPPPVQSTSQPTSPWIWMAVGAAIAIGTIKLIELIKTAPQRIQQAMMQQVD